MNTIKLLVFSSHFENILDSNHFDCETAQLPNTLIEVAHRHRPHAILIDASDLEKGLEAIHALRDDALTLYLPIVALVQKNTAAMEAVVTAGANDFVCIPTEGFEVETRVRSAIQNGHHPKRDIELLHITSRSMSGIVDLLTHDFRNPSGITLSSLQLVLEILQDTPDAYPPEVLVLMRHSLFASQRQAFLTEDLLDAFRLDMDELPLTIESVSLVPLLEKAKEYIQEAGKYNNITIELNPMSQIPPVLADEAVLGRVLTAALDTSLKFCMPGKTISLEAAIENNGVAIRIIDPGRPVLAPYDQERFFQLEFQNEARIQSSRSSVAMGMPFCYLAVQRMNGNIKIYTNQSSGLTTLQIWLPTA